ncbi:glutathionylspermidine synthase family protein [Mycoplasmatota bacterium]|nr:glutathionylspermidine synthase family protein [Mycoplasmatota bacterium]
MDASCINEMYIELIKNGDYETDYQKMINQATHLNLLYKGEPIPFLYHPMFFTEKDIKQFKNITKTLMSIGNKVIKEYIDSPSYRLKFGFPPLLEELILKDHGYDINIPIGRFDLFYNGDEFKFCELNTDGSSAMNEDNTLAKILLESKVLKKMKDTYQIDYLDCINTWVDESIKLYHEYSLSDEKPTVAIVDFKESATTYEFIEFKKAYENKGYNTLICDARDLEYINGKLFYESQQIDLIYRRIVTKELIDRSHEIEDFIKAYKDQAVCVIGPLKSQILHNKIIFKILHDEDTLELLSTDEKQFVKKHIPITKRFVGGYDVYEEVLENKDKYIIKPCDLYGSRGVYVGLDFSRKQWEGKLKKCFNNDYLYQEYFHPFERNFIEFENHKIKVSPFKCITGLFVYNEKFAGLYTRIGKNHIISGLHGYYTVPNLIIK